MTPEEKKARKKAYNAAYCASHQEYYRAHRKAYYQANKPKMQAVARARRAADPEKGRSYTRKRNRERLGIIGATDEQRVGACENTACDYVGPLCCDHDHATGLIRGWLCDRCNIAMGLMKDDPARLRGAATYLERPCLRLL